MSPRFPAVPQVIGARPRFKYSAPWSECRIIHEHSCMGTHLLIVGDPDCGGYEWVILISGEVVAHSNDGYGISEVALRDGLIEAFKDCFEPPLTPTSGATPAYPVAPSSTPSPTSLPLPSPRALRLASTLSKRSLQNLVGSHPLPSHVLQSRCNTILNNRGETEPLDAQDLQAAAIHLWKQKGYKPDLPPLTPAPAGCQESPAAPHAALAGSAAPAPHPKGESSPSSSSAKPSAYAAAGKQTAEDSCGDINCDGPCHLR